MTQRDLGKYWLPFACYAGFIFYLSSLPKAPIQLPQWNFDKILHLFEYIPFGFLLYRALAAVEGESLRQNIFRRVVILTAVYALLDELHQFYVPGRNADIWDALMDGIGGAMGAWVFLKWREKQLKKG